MKCEKCGSDEHQFHFPLDGLVTTKQFVGFPDFTFLMLDLVGKTGQITERSRTRGMSLYEVHGFLWPENALT